MTILFEDKALERAINLAYTVERTAPALRIHMHDPSDDTDLDILTISKEMATAPTVGLANVAGVTSPLMGVLAAIIQAYVAAGNIVKVGDYVTLGAVVCEVKSLPTHD